MKHVAIAAIVLACSLAIAGCATERYGQYHRGRYAARDTLTMMTKDDVIALTRAKVSDDVIIDQIKVTDSYFQLSTQDIVDLANAGVSDKVISAMIKTDEPPKYKTTGDYYYPPYSWWYAGYPYYPWYPSFYLGISYGYHHRGYFPHYGSFGGYRNFGGHGYGGGGGRGYGGTRSSGRHR
jgi:hypothetical protein